MFRKLNMSFDFGYMVLEPYSTFESVRSGIDFLDEFVGDGWTVATFCRTLPYAGTPIADKLRAEGRLLGSQFDPDYNFLDPRLDHFYDWMLHTFHRRNFTDAGLCHILRGLQFELHLDVAGRRPATAGEQAMGAIWHPSPTARRRTPCGQRWSTARRTRSSRCRRIRRTCSA